MNHLLSFHKSEIQKSFLAFETTALSLVNLERVSNDYFPLLEKH